MPSARFLAIWEAGFISGRVAAARLLAPGFRHVTLAAPLPEARAGAEIAIRFEDGEGRLEERHYSVWRTDPEAGTVDVCVVIHGQGPGSRWAARCEVGDCVELSVSSTLPVPLIGGAERHLFLGDETSIAASEALMRSLPEGEAASAAFEIASPDQRWPDEELARPSSVVWIPREGRPGASLCDWLGALALARPEALAAYVTGEAWLCATAHGRLVRDLGVPLKSIRALPFWKRRPLVVVA